MLGIHARSCHKLSTVGDCTATGATAPGKWVVKSARSPIVLTSAVSIEVAFNDSTKALFPVRLARLKSFKYQHQQIKF